MNTITTITFMVCSLKWGHIFDVSALKQITINNIKFSEFLVFISKIYPELKSGKS